MSERFYTILTNIGKAKIANAQATGGAINLTEIAVGDSNGQYYNPSETQTSLVNEVWRGGINEKYIDEDNENWIVIEAVIPTNQGGFYVREAGIFDTDGDMIAVGKYPETYKPELVDGSAKDLYVRMIIEVSNADNVQLSIDPAVILATRQYVDGQTSNLAEEIQNVDNKRASHEAETASDDVHGLGNKQGSISSSNDTGEVTTAHTRKVSASSGSRASGLNSQVTSSESSTATEAYTSVMSSLRCNSSASYASILSSQDSSAEISRSIILASRRVLSQSTQTVVGGDATSGGALTANRKWQIACNNGNIQHAGIISSGHSFTDFAELFPNLKGIEQGYGLLQTIDGHGVRPANEGERVIGVTSATAGVILGDTPFSWQGRWLKDEWGAYIYETIVDEDTGEEIQIPKENPDWNPEIEQQSRLERPDEWTVVGLIGQVYIRLEEDLEAMDYVKAGNEGVGRRSAEPTNIQVMKITQEYDTEKGYKIGFCLLK